MARGGKRPNSGRKANTPNAKTVARLAVAAKAVEGDVTPLDVMLDNMRFYHRGAGEALDKLMRGEIVTEEAIEAESAEDAIKQNVVEGMKTVLALRQLAGDAAKDAAVYLHQRLASVAVNHDVSDPIREFFESVCGTSIRPKP